MNPPSSEAANSGRGGLAGGFRRGVQRERDVVVGEVVGVAEHDGGALRGREAAGEVLDLGVRGPSVLDGQLGELVG